MKQIKFLLFFQLAALPAFSQWTGKVGINLPPLISKSVEITSEFSNRPWYSVTVDAGYTFPTEFIGLMVYLYHDGHDNRLSSGAYSRLGVRGYTPGFGPSGLVRFYINPMLVISSYCQSTEWRPDHLSEERIPFSAKGTVLIPAVRAGFTRPVNRRFTIDFGAQIAAKPNRDDLIGSPGRNYQPGTGVGERGMIFPRYMQGYLTLKYVMGANTP